jgi:hypothetical protein
MQPFSEFPSMVAIDRFDCTLEFWIIREYFSENSVLQLITEKKCVQLSLNISILCGWNLKRNFFFILNDRLFYFLSTAIVILIVIVIAIKHYDQKNEIYWQNVFNFNHSPIAINSLITQSAFIKYLKLLTIENTILIFHFYK